MKVFNFCKSLNESKFIGCYNAQMYIFFIHFSEKYYFIFIIIRVSKTVFMLLTIHKYFYLLFHDSLQNICLFILTLTSQMQFFYETFAYNYAFELCTCKFIQFNPPFKLNTTLIYPTYLEFYA